MGRYASHLAGRDYGKLGTVVAEPPQLTVHGYLNVHAQERAFERNMTHQDQMDVVSDPVVCLEQAQGYSFLFISERGAVVLTAQGEVRTTYGPTYFDPVIWGILAAAGANQGLV